MLAENLILLRNMKGMSQEQIAEVIGISRQSYAKWEQGETVPDIEKCDRLAKFYDITIGCIASSGKYSRKYQTGSGTTRKASVGDGDNRKQRADRDSEGCQRYF